MKSFSTLATLAAMLLCGCRSPRSITSTPEMGGHTLASADRATQHEAYSAQVSFPHQPPQGSPRPLPASELLARAEEALQADQRVVARGHLQAILVQQPRHPRAHHLLAVLADLDGRFRDAEAHYLAALQHDPHNADITGDLGYSYYLQRRFDESERLLEQAVAIDPRHATASKNLALLYAEQGEPSRAELLLRTALPVAEADAAMEQLRRDHGPQSESLLARVGLDRSPQPSGEELTQQIRDEMDAAAQADIAARERRRREWERREAAARSAALSAAGREPVMNPWTRQLSQIDGPEPAPQAGPLTIGPAPVDRRRTSATSDSTGGSAVPAAAPSTAGQTAGIDERRFAAESSSSDAAARQWPPATWAPLTEAETASLEQSRKQQSSHWQDDAHASSTIADGAQPWSGGVHYGIDRNRPAPARSAVFEAEPLWAAGDRTVRRAGGETAEQRYASDSESQPELRSLHTPPRPVEVPERTPTATSMTPRAAPGTDSVSSGAGYPPPDRDLPGRRNAAGDPTVVAQSPGGRTIRPERYQASRSAFNDSMNQSAEHTYGQSPSSHIPSPAAAIPAPAHEVPAYPYGPAAGARPPAAPTTGTPWPSRTAATPQTPNWSQGAPNSVAPAEADSTARSRPIVTPQPYSHRWQR